MTKNEARTQARTLRKKLDLHAIGAAMARQLFSLPAWQQAGTVFCFVSMRDEPDTLLILQQALADGRRLCVPRCLPGDEGQMDIVEITSLNDLQPGRYGILEPSGGRVTTLEPGALALIPCLAADRQGVRLGRGAGYYDRFLAQFVRTGGKKLLLCPEALLFDALPSDAWDIPFVSGEILTENGVR